MDYLNKWSAIGHLSKDPEFNESSGMCKVTLACDRPPGMKTDLQEADFVPLVAFRDLALTMIDYARTGRLVYVEGRLKIIQYRNGRNISYYTEVELDVLRFLDSPHSNQEPVEYYGQEQQRTNSHNSNSRKQNNRSTQRSNQRPQQSNMSGDPWSTSNKEEPQKHQNKDQRRMGNSANEFHKHVSGNGQQSRTSGIPSRTN
jgi:single-strand DNA-binding protein